MWFSETKKKILSRDMEYKHLFQLQLEIKAYTREGIDEAFASWIPTMEKEGVKFKGFEFAYSEPVWEEARKTYFWIKFFVEADDISYIEELGEFFSVIEEDYPTLEFQDYSHIIKLV